MRLAETSKDAKTQRTGLTSLLKDTKSVKHNESVQSLQLLVIQAVKVSQGALAILAIKTQWVAAATSMMDLEVALVWVEMVLLDAIKAIMKAVLDLCHAATVIRVEEATKEEDSITVIVAEEEHKMILFLEAEILIAIHMVWAMVEGKAPTVAHHRAQETTMQAVEVDHKVKAVMEEVISPLRRLEDIMQVAAQATTEVVIIMAIRASKDINLMISPIIHNLHLFNSQVVLPTLKTQTTAIGTTIRISSREVALTMVPLVVQTSTMITGPAVVAVRALQPVKSAMLHSYKTRIATRLTMRAQPQTILPKCSLLTTARLGKMDRPPQAGSPLTTMPQQQPTMASITAKVPMGKALPLLATMEPIMPQDRLTTTTTTRCTTITTIRERQELHLDSSHQCTDSSRLQLSMLVDKLHRDQMRQQAMEKLKAARTQRKTEEREAQLIEV